MQATNGDLYRTTFYGGTYGIGTVFQVTTEGTLTTLHSFDGADGANPEAGLVQANNGKPYGTTYYGGGYGTIFDITTGDALTMLHSFEGYPTDGSHPEAGLIQATYGNLYGTTTFGGASSACNLDGVIGCGTIFESTPAGAVTVLFSFDDADGAYPAAGLLLATNGNLYGTTTAGGPSGQGTIFSLSAGLGPFVETVPSSGKVGAKVTILGNNLSGSTSVTFNGTAATFTAKSSTEITTTVPTGATTGYVKVTTSTGHTLTSNVKFRVP